MAVKMGFLLAGFMSGCAERIGFEKFFEILKMGLRMGWNHAI